MNDDDFRAVIQEHEFKRDLAFSRVRQAVSVGDVKAGAKAIADWVDEGAFIDVFTQIYQDECLKPTK
jgi:hypothetical protein